jgi:hypothetical protein
MRAHRFRYRGRQRRILFVKRFLLSRLEVSHFGGDDNPVDVIKRPSLTATKEGAEQLRPNFPREIRAPERMRPPPPSSPRRQLKSMAIKREFPF